MILRTRQTTRAQKATTSMDDAPLTEPPGDGSPGVSARGDAADTAVPVLAPPAAPRDEHTRYVGLDVHKQQITYAILNHRGELIREGQIVLTRCLLTKFATTTLRSTDHVAFEATTNCWAVVDVLRPHVACVEVSNPMATKAIAQSKIKTDKVDARVLAQLLRCNFLPTVWQPDAATRLRRQICGRRASLVGQRTQLQNRVHSVLAMRLISPPDGMSLFGTAGLAWLNSLTDAHLDADGREMISSDLKLLTHIETEIAVFDKRLAQLAWEDQRVKLLMTIPGVSLVVGQALVAAFGDITRFQTPDAAASYLGLAPSTRQSASSVHHGPITKRGNSMARCMLIQAAQQYSRQAGPLGHFFQRIKRRKNHNVAVVATARKLAMIAWYMLTRNEPYRYATPRGTADKLGALRVAVTGEKRRGGAPKGQKAQAKLPGGSRTSKPLDDVYRNENLPTRNVLPPGELRHLDETGTRRFADGLNTTQIVPRRTAANSDQATSSTGRPPAKNQKNP